MSVQRHVSAFRKTGHCYESYMLSFLSGMWGTADVDIKIPSAENTGCQVSLFGTGQSITHGL